MITLKIFLLHFIFYNFPFFVQIRNLKYDFEGVEKAIRFIMSSRSNTLSQLNKMTMFIFIVCLIFAISLAIFYILKSNKNEILIMEMDKRLTQKRYLISKFESEGDVLNSINCVDMEILLNFAKTGDSNFYSKFLESFPLFEKKLLLVSPSLNFNDFVLLAYIYLNFDSKEIASISFRSIRTVQNKKYLLRKKLRLNTNENISFWLKENCF